ncbi:lipocalin family protein [Brevundimonas sp.]|uniref:lipocalin family protein n=1 Tax=Brevundimonas sp. TaxID=1871086 RepID=UPI002898A8BC|nr:lipocalin family protein [Brevundimonas sp.]
MSLKRLSVILIAAATCGLGLSACATFQRGPIGNPNVHLPTRMVDLSRYAGLWYEIGRYENGFERGCEGVTAEYTRRDDGLVGVLNTCRQGGVDGPVKTVEGRARVVPDSGDARLKVSFFGPFYLGDYWVLDHADDYSWSIVGEPSGRYLWLMSRTAKPSQEVRATILSRAAELGYDLALLHQTRHRP